jgi:hypothetical protein
MEGDMKWIYDKKKQALEILALLGFGIQIQSPISQRPISAD